MTRSQIADRGPRRPLDGIVVADFSRVLAGPLCTQMLADFGARVIKVEDPRGGDETRRWGPPFVDGVSTYYQSVNRAKESITLDLVRGKDVMARLLDRADVVVDNFLPRQRTRLLGNVRAKRRAIVHCSISGYDSDSKLADTPGYDLLAQAESGLMSITGEPDGDPVKAGVALADVLTAHHAFGAICAALTARERTGRGAAIEVSLFSSTIASLVNVAQAVLSTGREARRYGNEHASIVPYQLFHASDRPFVIGAGTDRHFEALCDVIRRDDLARDERFRTNAARVRHRDVLIPLLEEIFRTRRATEWVRRCRRAAVPATVVRGVREALRTPEARLFVSDAVGNPTRIDGKRAPHGMRPPALGADTDAILKELGFARRDIQIMRRERVI